MQLGGPSIGRRRKGNDIPHRRQLPDLTRRERNSEEEIIPSPWLLFIRMVPSEIRGMPEIFEKGLSESRFLFGRQICVWEIQDL